MEHDGNHPLWQPEEARIERANMTAFIRSVNKKLGLDLRDYTALYNWSTEHPEQFWSEVWDFCGIVSEKRGSTVLTNRDRMPDARWFPEARLNFVINLLRFNDSHTAIIFRNERGERRQWTYGELRTTVYRIAGALQAAGVTKGDRVAGFMPNIPETVAAMLAAAGLGATWSSCSPDFGVNGTLDRFGQIEPKVLFAADGYYYDGKILPLLPKISEIAAQLPGLEKTVIIPYTASAPAIDRISGAVLLDQFLTGLHQPAVEFSAWPFDHPLYILYSSGTTGLPKSIVHGAGGTLIQHLKELVLHTDLKRSDRIFYYTTCGWMMWNWLVSALAVGATIILYDGSPAYPDMRALFEIADRERMTVFGTSARYLSMLEKSGWIPKELFDLSSLRTILSTGSPLAPETFDYVYGSIKQDLCLSSISGGTDIISCFALGNPIGLVWRGELQTRGLGMSVEIYDENGNAVRGEKGELVCTRPFPSMPVSFWNDPGGQQYFNAYFNRFPGVWRHGDYACITEHNGLIIYGRSDAVLNPAGVRIGTAEIYRIVDAMAEVVESVCVGQEWKDDTRIVLFVKLQDGISLDDRLRREIRNLIRSNASPRHVPAKIVQVPDIPRTLNGKITEIAVREIIHGREVRNREALANPESLEHYKKIRDLYD